MKMEPIVIVNQHATVNMFSSLVHTARHSPEVMFIRISRIEKLFLMFMYFIYLFLKNF